MKWLVRAAGVLLALLILVPLARNREWRDLTEEVRRQAPGQFVRLSEGLVHYQIGGPADGPPVVLVHGVSIPMYVWDATFEALTAAGYRVLRYDIYGRGFSDRPQGPYDRDRFVGQLAELVDAVGLRKPLTVVGLSMGGAVTAAFAAEYPDAIDRLVLIAPLNRPVDIAPLDVPLVGDYLARAHVIPSFPQRQMDSFVEPEPFAHWRERFTEQMRYRGYARALLSTARHFAQRDPLADFQAIAARGADVLVVWGDQDATIPLEESVRVREAIPEARLVRVPAAGHLPHAERPEIVNPAILDFLRKAG